ncbi:MAG: DUF389 domain-containing protein [Acidimicrobiia bacterium]
MSRDTQSPDRPAVELQAEEFQDYEGPLLPEGAGFDLSQLLTADSLRGMAAIVVSVMVLRAPSTSPKRLAFLISVILVAWAVGGVIELRRSESRTGWDIARVLFLVVAAVGLVLIPNFTGENLGRAGGVTLIVLGFVNGYRAFRARESGSLLEPLLGAFFYLAIGAALVVSPTSILGLAILFLATYWFVAGVLTLVTNIRLDDRTIEPGGVWETLLAWIQGRPNTADDRRQLYDKLFYEGDIGPRRLSRFFTLMGFATGIAAFGIIADSTAVVIGAMLVAPLMTPLMGTSLAMVMGWPRRAAMSGGVALGGILFAIGLSVLFGWMYGPEISTVANSQVASRIGPTVVDLAIAIAAGGAGAFALSRPDVSDSLPGVAVAIALVPPLSVVGLMISQAEWSAASGALLLFITNLVAIILVGGAVFILTGVVPVLRLFENKSWVKKSLGMVAVLAIAVIATLGASADTFQKQTAGVAAAESIVAEWLGNSDLRVIRSEYSGDEFVIIVEGSEEPPQIDDLATAFEEEFGKPVGVSVKWVPTTTFEFAVDD